MIATNVLSPVPSLLCQTNADCPKNTKCDGFYCTCREGYKLDGTKTRCLRVATSYNDKCEDSLQCSEYLSWGGTCENSVCVCREGYHYLHGYCHKSKALGERCTKSEECFVDAEHGAAVCIGNICRCGLDYYQREYSTCRRLVKKARGKCLLNLDCQRGKCVDETCVDNFGKDINVTLAVGPKEIMNQNLKTGIGSSCTKNTDCPIDNSHCAPDNKCACERAYFPFDRSTCIPEIGENCSSQDPIKIDGSECESGRWTCACNRVNLKDNRNCQKIIMKIGAECQHKENCRLFGPRADCVEGKCVCDPSSHWVEGQSFCWVNKRVDDLCLLSHDCYTPKDSPKIVCKYRDNNPSPDRFCTCPQGTQPSYNHKYCVMENPELGSYCEGNYACNVPNSKCRDNKCQCEEYHYEYNGACFAGLGSSCQVDDDCEVPDAWCFMRKCECREGLPSPNHKCLLPADYHGRCEEDQQCTAKVNNSLCYNIPGFTFKMCQCKTGFNYYPEDNTCYEPKKLGQPCNSHGECFAEGRFPAACVNGLCKCDSHVDENSAPAAHGMSSIEAWLALPAAGLFVLKFLR